jgi:4-carboxymuconolactone decarboxylase
VNQESYVRGLRLFRQMAGREAETIRRGWRRLAPDFERYVLGFLAGEVWRRPVLNLRTRSLVTMAALAAMGRSQGLALNIRMALNNGVSRGEILETFIHLAPYIGFPAAWDALALAGRVVRGAPRRRGRRSPRRRRR